ncbi:MAG: prepilin-type N-terminal cleavage/methylation domain-containing protein [Candidatus Sericytochromatia bacterium]|uniref:Prepilin-type N-terminal cleavage/methylation domain-containing protein n=1 Tax=Candidatus Tanganyikabacteria bacterium TaxID=2961651 RepID=A0A937X5B4_9BACT|nr:prepilin-type N-terminal cleavage/methylation domain-containing protein [Candidatus Tanganyikabacteria bacterium]
MQSKAPKQKGFTLIELLVVVVIIGILASVAVPNFMGAQDKAKNSGVQANTHNVQMALEQSAVDNAGVYPKDQTELNDKVVKDAGYMAGATYPRTPWGMQQGGGIYMGDVQAPFTEAASAGTTIGDGKNQAPGATTDYGAVSYRGGDKIKASANERYNMAGSGKKNDKAVIAIFLKNY